MPERTGVHSWGWALILAESTHKGGELHLHYASSGCWLSPSTVISCRPMPHPFLSIALEGVVVNQINAGFLLSGHANGCGQRITLFEGSWMGMVQAGVASVCGVGSICHYHGAG